MSTYCGVLGCISHTHVCGVCNGYLECRATSLARCRTVCDDCA